MEAEIPVIQNYTPKQEYTEMSVDQSVVDGEKIILPIPDAFIGAEQGCEMYSCYICGLHYNILELLKIHTDTHDYNAPGPNNYTTDGASVGPFFTRETTMTPSGSTEHHESELRKEDKHPLPSEPHPKPVHTVEQRFPCDQCPGTFTRKSYLHEHSLRLHADQNPFVCSECLKSFPTESSLDDHMIVHCTEPNYMYVKHKTLHHRKKQFRCDKCGLRYAKEWCLVLHQRSHSGEFKFKCETCHNCFATDLELEQHLKLRNAGITLSCKFCPRKVFCTMRDLNAHLKLHF